MADQQNGTAPLHLAACNEDEPLPATEQPVASVSAPSQPAYGLNVPTTHTAVHQNTDRSDCKQQERQRHRESFVDFAALAAQCSGATNNESRLDQEPQPRQQQGKACSAEGRKAASAPALPRSGGCGAKSESARHSWPSAMRRVVRSVMSLGTARLAPHQPSSSQSPQQQAADYAAMNSANVLEAHRAERASSPSSQGTSASASERIHSESIAGTAEALQPATLPAPATLQRDNTVPQERWDACEVSPKQRVTIGGDATGHAHQSAQLLLDESARMTAAMTPADMCTEQADNAQAAVAAVQPAAVDLHSQADTTDTMQPAMTAQLVEASPQLSQPGNHASAPSQPSQIPRQPSVPHKTLAPSPQWCAVQAANGGSSCDAHSKPHALPVLPGGPTELLSDPLKSPMDPGLKRKAAGETGSPAGWLWALPSKRQKTTHVLSMPSMQVAILIHD